VSASDTSIAQYAVEQNFVVLTRDLDFGDILSATKALRPSVFQFRGPKQFPEEIGGRVLMLVTQLEHELETGVFVSIDLSKTRFRLLPLHRNQ
jgi:predicted nuclease of predicted toxin-antitoxin system